MINLKESKEVLLAKNKMAMENCYLRIVIANITKVSKKSRHIKRREIYEANQDIAVLKTERSIISSNLLIKSLPN